MGRETYFKYIGKPQSLQFRHGKARKDSKFGAFLKQSCQLHHTWEVEPDNTERLPSVRIFLDNHYPSQLSLALDSFGSIADASFSVFNNSPVWSSVALRRLQLEGVQEFNSLEGTHACVQVSHCSTTT